MKQGIGFSCFPKKMVSVFIIGCVLATLAVLPMVASAATASAVPGTVRVSLVKQADTLSFKVNGAYQLVDQSTGQIIAVPDKNEIWQVMISSGRIELQGPKAHYGPFSGPVVVRESNFHVSILNGSGEIAEKFSADGLLAISSEGKVTPAGTGAFSSVMSAGGSMSLSGGGGAGVIALSISEGTTRYRGAVEFRVETGKLAALNELNIEDYLRGVVPSEMPSTWPAEALKAQAVAARNYAMQRVEATRGRTFNVGDDQSSQVYCGYDAETAATDRAVEETSGMVMLSQGSLVSAFFHSSSGGYVENSEDVWSNPLPYIKYKADPYDKNDLHYNWQVNFTADQLVGQMKEDGYTFKKVADIEELARTASGVRVKKIVVKGEGLKGEPVRAQFSNADNVRIALGLKSSLFTMNKTYDKDKKLIAVNIKGSGWGHGLGMPQWGAYGMAKQGYKYQDILKYYYTGVTLAAGYGRLPTLQ